MVLESQRIRPGANRGYVGSARRKRRGRMRLVAALMIVGGGLYLGFNLFGGNGGDADDPDIGPDDSNASTPADGPGDAGQSPAPRRDPWTRTDDHPLLGGTGPTTAPPPDTVDRSDTTTDAAATATPPPPPPPAPVTHADDTVTTDAEVRRQIDRGRQLIQAGDLPQARRYLNAALHGRISGTDAQTVRRELTKINEVLIFSKRIVQDDPLCAVFIATAQKYQLSKIAPEYTVPWQLIQRINRINPRRIRVGQRMKIPRGPFHMVIVKHAYRADAYLESEEGPVFVRSFPVGLGEQDSTPIGHFVVRRNSKLANPKWVNPRTGKVYEPDNPSNPIGERWIGLTGADEQTRQMSGYGLHGTIEPQSIGREASMGCVRFLPEDIELVYDMLIGGKSRVVIKP